MFSGFSLWYNSAYDVSMCKVEKKSPLEYVFIVKTFLYITMTVTNKFEMKLNLTVSIKSTNMLKNALCIMNLLFGELDKQVGAFYCGQDFCCYLACYTVLKKSI